MSTAAVRGTGPLNPALLPAAPAPATRTKSAAPAPAAAPAAPANTASNAKLSSTDMCQGSAKAACSLETPEACVEPSTGKAPKTFFINGIRTPERNAKETQALISERLGGTPVELVYNPTHGLIADAAESLMNITGVDTKIAKDMQGRLRKALDAGETVRVFAHSQGAAITGDALHDIAAAYKKAGKSDADVAKIMSRVEVISFGGFADQDSYPEGVKFKLNREKDDAIPQLASSCLAVGKDYREVCAEPKKVKNWLDLGGSILSGIETTGRTAAHNAGQAVVSAYRNSDKLWDAFGKGKFFDNLFKGDVDAACGQFNAKSLDAYCAQIGKDVTSDHVTVLLDSKGNASAGYVVKYFDGLRGRSQDGVA
ncbi:MAG: hypothetical protein AB7I41_23865 [Candidatus Sericytochromatia bacterium]